MRMLLTESPNPLLPAHYDIVWTLILGAVLALMLTALWQALRSKAHTGVEQLLWALVILVAPVLGPLAWFALGRSRRATPGHAA